MLTVNLPYLGILPKTFYNAVHLKACGFKYGNDTLRAEVQAAEPLPSFSAETDSLGAGRYFAVAYAQNGMGTSYGDTLYFTVSDVDNE